MVNETVALASFIYFSFLSYSWPTIKNMAAINVTSLNKTDVLSSPQNFVYPRMHRVFISSWLKLVVLLPDLFMIKRGGEAKKEQQNLQDIFVYNLESLRLYFYLRYISWLQEGAGYRKHGFLKSVFNEAIMY